MLIAPVAPRSQVGGPPTQTEPPDRFPHTKLDKKEDDDEDDEIQLQLGEFKLPPPPRITAEQAHRAALEAVDRMFLLIDEFEKTSLISRKSKLGVNRLAASNWDREGWITLLTRMATRGSHEETVVKSESGEFMSLANAIRERLFQFVTEDFRGRMDVAVAWLNEEWYNDKIMASSGFTREQQYSKWMVKTMDAIFPFLEARDRLFMRMLSEIPEIPEELLDKVKILCLDPDRATLGIQMLQ